METIRYSSTALFLEGALTVTKWLEGKEIRIFPIPKEAAWIAIHAVHLTVGHRSPTQLVKQVAGHFEFENMRKLIDQYIGKCVPCTLLRNEAKYVKSQTFSAKLN